LPTRRLLDAVACAVADALEALDGTPVSMARARAAALAALTSAHELRLDLDDAVRAFAPQREQETKPRASRARRRA
jgi:hypothetical protein